MCLVECHLAINDLFYMVFDHCVSLLDLNTVLVFAGLLCPILGDGEGPALHEVI
jgi:hypothetical protein